MDSYFTKKEIMSPISFSIPIKQKSNLRRSSKTGICGAELDDIQNAYTAFIPLNPGIKTAIRIVPEEQTNCKRGGEYCVLLYSEKKDGYLQNIGYLGEQLDLYLVSVNIGAIWFGIGKTQEKPFEDMEFSL